MAVEKKAEKLFRGKTVDELKELDSREFARYLKSRERRSLLRQSEVIEKFLLKCEKNGAKGKMIKTHNRNIIVMPKMVGLKIGIYNGKEFVSIQIVPEMIGHRLGEFSHTRKKITHSAPGIGATRSSAAMSVK